MRILIGDDHLLFREGLRRLLEPSQFSLAGEARNLAAFAASLEEEGLAPDLVVAELNGCLETDVDSLRKLRAAHDDLRIVVLANQLSLPEMARLLRAGADGYLVNELSAEAFSLSLLLVMKGEKVLPSTLASMLASGSESSNGGLTEAQKKLTEREKQILQCLLNAYSNKHIARALNISEGTVKVHLKALMKKISAGNRTQAALWARNNGIDTGHLIAG